MISIKDIEKRIYNYFDTLMLSDGVLFGFSAASASYMVDHQSNAVRPAASTVLLYRIEHNRPVGNQIASDRSVVDRTSGQEQMYIWRDLHVIVNILSKIKGAAKGAMSYLMMLNQSSRHYEAAYNAPSATFDLPCYNIDNNIRDLTALENENWGYVERIESDWYFNYSDIIKLAPTGYLVYAPSSVYDTPQVVEFDIELKN